MVIRGSMCSDVVVSYEDHRVEPKYRYAMEIVEPFCAADYLTDTQQYDSSFSQIFSTNNSQLFKEHSQARTSPKNHSVWTDTPASTDTSTASTALVGSTSMEHVAKIVSSTTGRSSTPSRLKAHPVHPVILDEVWIFQK
ncbi:hypothetical protein CSAL01_10614 [Colletotrichum salicis]|uniref:Uncharacterized protein n=1 Tax=Colletotrichum salicis TaxID=1209931 RepID=A0A135UCL3_9PEZI|nr:hypothetical protein CSAL01_10614 [Colletotrichum salicis]